MGASLSIANLATLCKRYGPGRFPAADRPCIGAGYAGGSAALGVAVTYALVMYRLHTMGSLSSWFANPLWMAAALVAIPVIVPAAFVAGAVVWRVLPDSIPWFGAVAGLLAAVGTYAVSLTVLFVLFAAGSMLGGLGTSGGSVVLEAAVLTGVIGGYAVVLTGWLALPVGCLSGAIYERARVVPVDA